MSTQTSLPELLSVLRDTYRCIDIRTIGAELDGVVYNVVTSIRFSVSPCSHCEQDVKHRLRTYGVLVEGLLRFGSHSLQIRDLGTLQEQLRSGELNTREVDAKLGASISFDRFASTISDHPGYLANESHFPALQASIASFPLDIVSTDLGRRVQYACNAPEVQKQLSRSGFHGFRELAANYLGAANSDINGPSMIVVVAPVPARVTHVEVDPASKVLRVHIQRNRRLSKALRIRGEIANGQWQKNKPLTFGPVQSRKRESAAASAPFELDSLNDHVQLRLVHNRLGIVSTPTFPIRSSTPATYVNPFFEALKRFCSAEELRSLCTQPKTLPNLGKGKEMPQRLFEQHIQWLLSCFGFAAIQLGSKESLSEIDEIRGVKMARGSLDLLAYNEERRLLLLGSCKLNPPPDKDFNNLVNVKAALAKSLPQSSGINIALGIFTAADHCLAHAGYRGENFVAVFDNRAVLSLIDALESGDKESLFSCFADVPEMASTQEILL